LIVLQTENWLLWLSFFLFCWWFLRGFFISFSRFWFFYFWGWFWELLEFKFFFINKFDFFIKLKGNDSSYITDHCFDGEEFIHKSNFHLIIRINKFT
jgi:hypothetical protein